MATADFFTPGMAYMTEPGQLVTVFMEGEQVYSIGGLLRIALERREISTRVHGFVHDLKEAEQAAQGADCLVGVPGQMALLAEAAPKLRPKTVLLSGDYVPQSVVRRLESIWECEVFQHWGMTETGYGGRRRVRSSLRYHLRCRSHDRDYPSGDRRKCAERYLGGSCILCVCPQGHAASPLPDRRYWPFLSGYVRLRRCSAAPG